MLHLLAWEELPSPSQRESLRRSLATAMTRIPRTVFNVIRAYP
jgi:citrate synthase